MYMRDEIWPYEAWVLAKREDRWKDKWERVMCNWRGGRTDGRGC